MKTIKSIIIVSVLFCFGCSLFKTSIVIDNEYRMNFISEALKIEYADFFSENKPLFINKDFSSPMLALNIAVEECMRGVGKVDKDYPKTLEALKNYCELRDKYNHQSVSSIGKLSINHIFVDGADGETNIYKKYPEAAKVGWISFSMPGFSDDGSVAIMEWSRGAGGGVYVFEKRNNQWKSCICGLPTGFYVSSR